LPANKQTATTVAAIALFDARVVTMEGVVSDALKLAAHAVDVLKRQAFEGISAGQLALGKGWLAELEVATRALDRMVTAQVTLDKTAKDRAGKLDAAGRYRVMMRYCQSEMPAAERARFVRELAEYHQAVRRTPGPAPAAKHLAALAKDEDAPVPSDDSGGPSDGPPAGPGLVVAELPSEPLGGDGPVDPVE
jgi:hypothetical protein